MLPRLIHFSSLLGPCRPCRGKQLVWDFDRIMFVYFPFSHMIIVVIAVVLIPPILCFP